MTASDERLVASPSQTVGPFFHFGLATEPLLGQMAGPGTAGERIHLRVRVLDGGGEPVPDALIELWQADTEGRYVEQPNGAATDPGQAFRGWGRLPTGPTGDCEFLTIMPGPTMTSGGERQAAHINVCLFARGMLRHIFTRIYFDADPMIAADPVLALIPEPRRDTLLAKRSDDGWMFEIRMQGDGETVFFDL